MLPHFPTVIPVPLRQLFSTFQQFSFYSILIFLIYLFIVGFFWLFSFRNIYWHAIVEDKDLTLSYAFQFPTLIFQYSNITILTQLYYTYDCTNLAFWWNCHILWLNFLLSYKLACFLLTIRSSLTQPTL